MVDGRDALDIACSHVCAALDERFPLNILSFGGHVVYDSFFCF